MDATDLLNHVKSSAQLAGIPMTDERAQRVAEHLNRTLQMAQMLNAHPIDDSVEIPQMFVPGPFPHLGDEL
jgi:Asp-tRNA(Asn)/Glu-tRNA(Gln) amidotransferase C subunit